MPAHILRTNRPHGFTLIELLVVIAIIGILAGLLLPVLAKAKQEARKMECGNNQHQLSLAMHMYSDVSTHDGLFPSKQGPGGSSLLDLNLLFDAYAANPKVFSCPGAPLPTIQNLSTASDGSTAPNLSSSMTNLGYDNTHRPEDSVAIILADFKGASPGSNATCHGMNGSRGAGQMVTDCSGSSRFIDSTVVSIRTGVNDDIYKSDSAGGSGNGGLTAAQDSFVRQ